MLSDEINVYGFIKVPYSYLNDYLAKIQELKGKKIYKDFPDFIMPPLNCINNPISSFAFSFRYEIEFENVLMERFEFFLDEITFLFATLIIDIESKSYFFYEYIFDGTHTHKSINKIIPSL